jgi:hypothetical protein
MEQIPQDGSYFLDKCHWLGCRIAQPTLVRKISFVVEGEGYLCEKHWGEFMSNRQWMNEYRQEGKKLPVYAFFHPDPQYKDIDHKLLVELDLRQEWSDDFIVWGVDVENKETVQMFVATINGGADGHRNTANWKQDVSFADVQSEIDAIMQSFSNDEVVVVIVLRADLPFKSARTFAQDIADYELSLYDLNRRKKLIDKDQPDDVQMQLMDLSMGASSNYFDVYYAYEPEGARCYASNISRGKLQETLDSLEDSVSLLRRDKVLYVLFDHSQDKFVLRDRIIAVARLWLKEDFEDA